MPLISSERLEAFAAVAAEGSFTRGARRIGVTQPAVSQRIRKLEEELAVTLFVRRHDRVRLTAEGEALLGYVRTREGLEAELLSGLGGTRAKSGEPHVGVLRVAGFSSVTRSIVVPALAPLLRASPGVVAHVSARELRDLPLALRSGEADLVLTDRAIEDASVESVHVGDEQNVLVDAPGGSEARFLDHDPDDTITDRFARLNDLDVRGTPRAYLDDIYGILDGVAAGWGRAVVSAHLVAPPLRIVPGYAPLRTAVYLHRRASRHRTALERAAVEAIVAECARVLAGVPAAAPRRPTRPSRPRRA